MLNYYNLFSTFYFTFYNLKNLILSHVQKWLNILKFLINLYNSYLHYTN